MRLWGMGHADRVGEPILGRLTRVPLEAHDARADHIAFGTAIELTAFASQWDGYAGVLCMDPQEISPSPPLPTVYAPAGLAYLAPGDVVALEPDGGVSALYRRNSPHNTILVTEVCNSFCLMCSQPPKEIDDSWRVARILRLLELIDRETRELGFSGGEPTLLGDDLIRIVSKALQVLPNTALHILTNGRRFQDASFADRLGAVGHPDLMLGIPLYSDVDSLHDYVVQARGAFEETLHGFYNLNAAGVRLELRVVLHKQTYERLPQLAEFIGRNLPFVEHVALMGLEMFGFTPWNLDKLWVDPVDYALQLQEATLSLATRGMTVSIYNHQLCTIPRSLWPFAAKSISDWKNVYLAECSDCGVKDRCGGFFQSATKRHSSHITPLTP